METEEILCTLLESPAALQIIHQANEIIAKESEARLRFYDFIDEDSKAEFINGEVIFHSPVMLRHLKVSVNLTFLLQYHIKQFNVGLIGVEKMMVSLTRNDYEPDICFYRKELADTFTPKQLLFPAPDMIVEILSDSTVKYDRGIKKTDYAAHGVAEYWIVDLEAMTIEQYVLDNKAFILKKIMGKDGNLLSEAVKGFMVEWGQVFS